MQHIDRSRMIEEAKACAHRLHREATTKFWIDVVQALRRLFQRRNEPRWG